MKNETREALAKAIAKAADLEAEAVAQALERPKNTDFGDLAFPCFLLAKAWKEKPQAAALRLKDKLCLPAGIEESVPTGPYLNFRFQRSTFAHAVIKSILSAETPEKADKRGDTVLVEYSSPNIAKPFHVGHLRTTLIGNCLDRVHRYLGYNTISINHLGDWGTQFGFVWAGCQLWGKPKDPDVHKLVDLYRQATALRDRQIEGETTIDEGCYPDINEMARQFFLDLEKKEAYARDFWQWCLDISLEYLKHTYQRLNITFDHFIGESFYADKLSAVEDEFRNSGILQESEGALGVDLGEEAGFARIMTPDGRSLYLTRDIAAAMYRAERWQFDKALYVVGAPQTLHFQQLKGVLSALGRDYADRLEHVPFGHVLGMKTRGDGEVVELNDFLDEAYERALSAYREQVTKRPAGLDEEAVARGVALGAIVFSNLSRARIKDVHFKWEHALEFQGDSGPYLLYAYARINGIKQKALPDGDPIAADFDPEQLSEDSAHQLVARISEFDEALARTVSESEPCHLAGYALELAKTFSKAYLELKVVGVEKTLADARLSLFEASRLVLKEALGLLGIEPLERM